MRPLSVITAIVFGSAAAAAFSLVSVLLIFLVLQGRHPEFSAQLWPLVRSSASITALAAVSGLSLYALFKQTSWRWFAQVGMWLSLSVIGAMYLVG